MYLSGQITIDPSELTEIAKTAPTKGFAKMAYYLTGGLASKKGEHETFTAVTILQQINVVMRAVGVDNIVELAKDDELLYEDKEGKKDDFKEAIQQFMQSSDRTTNTLFNTLSLVLEHEMNDLVYLIDIQINRSHEVGEYPIIMIVNGLLTEFRAEPGESGDKLIERMKGSFDSQENYDAIVEKAKTSFNSFLDAIEEAFRTHMRVDSIHRSSATRIIRSPGDDATDIRDRPRSHLVSRGYHDPIYYGYYGFSDYFLYAWLWSDMCHHHHIHCHDVSIVDETGHDVLQVDETGLDMGAQDPAELGAVTQESVTPVTGGGDGGVGVGDGVGSSDSGGGWFSSVFSGGDGGGGGWDGGGGDAGGGCGGCGGGE